MLFLILKVFSKSIYILQNWKKMYILKYSTNWIGRLQSITMEMVLSFKIKPCNSCLFVDLWLCHFFIHYILCVSKEAFFNSNSRWWFSVFILFVNRRGGPNVKNKKGFYRIPYFSGLMYLCVVLYSILKLY